MTRHTKVRRLLLAGAVAAAIAAPSAGASTAKYVHIGGELVRPSQVSEFQALAGVPVGAHLVQIHGKLVRPSQLSTIQAQGLRSGPARPSSQDDGSAWTSGGISIGIVLAGFLLAVAGAVGVQRRRDRLGTA